jgi:hypothetical protein
VSSKQRLKELVIFESSSTINILPFFTAIFDEGNGDDKDEDDSIGGNGEYCMIYLFTKRLASLK